MFESIKGSQMSRKIFCKCGRIRVDGKCPKCKRKPSQKARKQDAYNSEIWKKISRFHRTRWPLCVHCEREGQTTVIAPGDKSGVVDHIVPFSSFQDEKFLDTYNHQGLCSACHNNKTNKEQAGTYSSDMVQRDLDERKRTLDEEF